MKPLSECLLYTFVDTAYLHGREPREVARQLCHGGSDLIQLRAKASSVDYICRMAEEILPITRAADVGLVVNDYFAVAQRLGAEYCHLGQEDFFGSGGPNVTDLLSTGPLRIGLSSHAPAQAERAIAAGAAYIPLRPRFSPGPHPAPKPPPLGAV